MPGIVVMGRGYSNIFNPDKLLNENKRNFGNGVKEMLAKKNVIPSNHISHSFHSYKI
jgi:hypothetical protein